MSEPSFVVMTLVWVGWVEERIDDLLYEKRETHISDISKLYPP